MKYHTFKPRFHAFIISKRKRSTIRMTSTIKPGEKFGCRLWTGKPYRSPMGWLGTAVCQRISPISIVDDTTVSIRGHVQSDSHLDLLAYYEGFEDWEDMANYFMENHGFPVNAILNEWDETFTQGQP